MGMHPNQATQHFLALKLGDKPFNCVVNVTLQCRQLLLSYTLRVTASLGIDLMRLA
jgi:hypothetical protein